MTSTSRVMTTASVNATSKISYARFLSPLRAYPRGAPLLQRAWFVNATRTFSSKKSTTVNKDNNNNDVDAKEDETDYLALQHFTDLPLKIFEPHGTIRPPSHTTIATPAKPAIILLPDEFGLLTEQMSNHAERLANWTGMVTILPDLLHGLKKRDVSLHDPYDAVLNRVELKTDQLLICLQKLIDDHLRVGDTASRKVGVLGFSQLGGKLAFDLATQYVPNSDSNKRPPLDACVAFYGVPTEPDKLDPRILQLPLFTPTQLHIGRLDHIDIVEMGQRLERDWTEAVTKDLENLISSKAGSSGMRKWSEEELRRHKDIVNVFWYDDVGHAFMNDTTPQKLHHHKKSSSATPPRTKPKLEEPDPKIIERQKMNAEIAWKRTVAFLKNYLKELK